MKKNLASRFLIYTIVVIGFSGFRQPQVEKTTTPNVIFILTEDMGYGDLECYGGFPCHTPNINKLAASGMRFTNFYVAQATCSASRSACLTGLGDELTKITGTEVSPAAKVNFTGYKF